MALLLKNKTYLKFEIDGTFYVYKNKAARNRTKSAKHSSNEVLTKYTGLLMELNSAERRRYDPNWVETLSQWETELAKYRKNLQLAITNDDYPLIQQYIENINETIPEIISGGQLPKLAKEADYSLDKIYKLAKDYEIFGKKEDIKNC